MTIAPGFYDVEVSTLDGWMRDGWIRGAQVISQDPSGLVVAKCPMWFWDGTGPMRRTSLVIQMRYAKFHPIDIAAEAREGRGS